MDSVIIHARKIFEAKILYILSLVCKVLFVHTSVNKELIQWESLLVVFINTI